jgi:hypothetical protein
MTGSWSSCSVTALLFLLNVVFSVSEDERLKVLSFGGNGNIGSAVLSQLIDTNREPSLLYMMHKCTLKKINTLSQFFKH